MRTALLFSILALAGAGTLRAQSATFYLVDIGHGNAAFSISPSGEILLMDCGGSPGTPARIYNFMQQNGLKKIDYLVVSHFENDHMGSAPELSKKVPIINWVDHGESVTYGKTDEWWYARRGPWSRPGMAKADDARMDTFKAARATGNHIIVKAGDSRPCWRLRGWTCGRPRRSWAAARRATTRKTT